MNTQHTLIIGGTKGIGLEIAKHFSNIGHRVSACGRTLPEKATIPEKNISFFSMDLLFLQQIPKVLQEILKMNGTVTNIVFCQRYRGKEDSWNAEFTVSLTSTKTILDYFLELKQNVSVVVISSIAAECISTDQDASYHVSKGGLNQLIRYYAAMYTRMGMRINGISPGTVLKKENTEFYNAHSAIKGMYDQNNPIGRMITSKDIAYLTEFLCSDKAAAITGQIITVDGGISLISHGSFGRKFINQDD
jgi:3-oxoacyl-[acyl-carrier protein] reductase